MSHFSIKKKKNIVFWLTSWYFLFFISQSWVAWFTTWLPFLRTSGKSTITRFFFNIFTWKNYCNHLKHMLFKLNNIHRKKFVRDAALPLVLLRHYTGVLRAAQRPTYATRVIGGFLLAVNPWKEPGKFKVRKRMKRHDDARVKLIFNEFS